MYNELKNISLLILLLFFTSCGIFKPSSVDLTKNRSKSRANTTKVRVVKKPTRTNSSSRSTNSSSISTSKINESSKQNLRNEIAREAKRYVGIPYQYGGKKPTGFDCSGLTSFVLKKHNVAIADGSFNQAKQGKRVPLEKAQTGDLVFFGKTEKSIM